MEPPECGSEYPDVHEAVFFRFRAHLGHCTVDVLLGRGSLLHADATRHLRESQGEQVLIHQDLHGNNVLNAERETWLVIDPKPLIGEREFALAPIIRSREFGHGKEHVIGRLDRLSYELGLNRERARGWALGQTIAWAFDNDHIQPHHLETARWLFEAP